MVLRKNNKVDYWKIMAGLVVMSILVGIYVYPSMPEKMASHWNAQGQVNGYLPKFWALFLMPLFSAVLLLMFFLIPKLDPLKENIERFREHYERFATMVMAFFVYIYLLTIFLNGDASRSGMMRFLSPALGGLIYYSGVMMENAKRNWFIGIRTPWTLSSDRVWNKTHAIGGKLFKISGVIAFLGVVFPDYAFFLVIAPLLLSALYVTIYSYIEYKKKPVVKDGRARKKGA